MKRRTFPAFALRRSITYLRGMIESYFRYMMLVLLLSATGLLLSQCKKDEKPRPYNASYIYGIYYGYTLEYNSVKDTGGTSLSDTSYADEFIVTSYGDSTVQITGKYNRKWLFTYKPENLYLSGDSSNGFSFAFSEPDTLKHYSISTDTAAGVISTKGRAFMGINILAH